MRYETLSHGDEDRRMFLAGGEEDRGVIAQDPAGGVHREFRMVVGLAEVHQNDCLQPIVFHLRQQIRARLV